MTTTGNPNGRPPKYTSLEQVEGRIEAYFESRDGDNRPTVTGLALALDLSRQQLIEYSNREQFHDAIKKAKLRVEEFIENRLYENNVAGCIFNLKNNFGWEDRTQTDQTVRLGLTDAKSKLLRGIVLDTPEE